MKKYFLLVFSLFLVSSCNKSEDENIPEPQQLADISIIDIKNESDYDYWVYLKTGDNLILKEENGLPTEVFINKENSEKVNYINFDETGKPDELIIDSFKFIFSNYEGSSVDITIMYPNGVIENIADVDTGVDWNEISSKNSNIKSKTSGFNALHIMGWGLKSVGCALATAKAIGTGFVVTWPIMILPCGSLIFDVLIAVAVNTEIFDSSSSFIQGIKAVKANFSLLQCANISSIGCYTSALGGQFIDWGNEFEVIKESSEELVNGKWYWDKFVEDGWDIDLTDCEKLSNIEFFSNMTGISRGYDENCKSEIGDESFTWEVYGNDLTFINYGDDFQTVKTQIVELTNSTFAFQFTVIDNIDGDYIVTQTFKK
jgi:lipocalin-like protein